MQINVLELAERFKKAGEIVFTDLCTDIVDQQSPQPWTPFLKKPAKIVVNVSAVEFELSQVWLQILSDLGSGIAMP